uniref:Uncharacterized protein n=1 Tax=Globisporangium ultimum (strain ATCC 200006 / CBS 805.95 / DAOM BR144) TaxID=431595 RepID=K3X4K3_GLOUD
MYFVLAAIHASQVAIFLFRSVRRRKLIFRGQGDSLLAQPTATTYLVSVDVRSKYYGLVFLFRELVLTFLQTYQTYRLSCLVPRLWMNNVMVALLVFNCWATPFLHHAFRSNVGRVRLAGALVNMLLDMVSYFGLPAALLMPYANNIDKNLKNFNRSFWYTDIWLIEMINEAQLIFVTSVFDVISKFLIALSVARGLRNSQQ